MLREHARSFEGLTVAADLTLVTISLVLANGLLGHSPSTILFTEYGHFTLTCCIVWLLCLRHFGLYRSLRTRTFSFLWSILAQVTLLALALNALTFILLAPGLDRQVYMLHAALAFGLLASWKTMIRAAQIALRRRGYNFRRVVVVGTEKGAAQFISQVEEHGEWGLQVLGCVRANGEPEGKVCTKRPLLGTLDDLVEICKTQTVDEVLFTTLPASTESNTVILRRLEAMGIPIRMMLTSYLPEHGRVILGFLGDTAVPVVTYSRVTLDPVQLRLKRLLDVVGGLLGVAFTAALFPFIALAIKLESPGPVLFRQSRVGQNGRAFTIYKFRTMQMDAEERKGELLAHNEMNGAIFKIRNDPRVTRVGRVLRKTSLDELPQFGNVLRGEMSLVGTRPPTPDEVIRYQEWQRGRMAIKPGLTGVWQTSGRNGIEDFDQICELDLSYVDNWSIWLDLKLLAKTFGVVLLGVGAR